MLRHNLFVFTQGIIPEVVINYILNYLNHYLFCPLLIEGRVNAGRLCRFVQPRNVFVEVDESVVFKVDDIEDSMSPGCGSLIHGQKHVLLIGDNLVEEGTVESKILLLMVSIGSPHELQNLELASNFNHLLMLDISRNQSAFI